MKTRWKVTAFLPILALFLSGCLKEGEKETLTYSASSVEINAVQSGSVSVDIFSNFMWTIESTATWLNVTPQKGFGDKKLEISVSPNTSLDSRQASFFIVGEETRQEIKVTQKGEAPTLTLKSSSATAPAAGAEIEAELSTNLEIEVKSDVPWVTRITTKAITESKYYFKVEQNTSLESRTANITFSQKGGSVKQVFTIVQQGEAPGIVLSKKSVSVNAEANTEVVEVTANVPWTAVPSKDWITIRQGTKLMERSNCIFDIEANPSAEAREAVIIFSKTGTTELAQTLSISQAAAAPYMNFTPASYAEIPAAGSGPNTITVDANFPWLADFSGTASWLSDLTFDGTSCSFKASANQGISARSTKIVFKQVDGIFTKEFSITQNAAVAQMTILPRQADLPDVAAAGGMVMVFVTANVDWKFEVDKPWLKIESSPFEQNAQTTVLRCTAEKNTDSEARTVKVSFISDYEIKTLTIKQLAGATQLSASLDKIDATVDGISRELKITSNVPWTAVTSAQWITLKQVPKLKSALADSVILVEVAKNTSLKARRDTIFIKQTGGDMRDTVVVSQAGLTPVFNITASKANNIKATGDELSLTVTANFPVGYVSVDQSWVTVKADSTAGKKYNFTVSATNRKDPRTAVITFKNINGEAEVVKEYKLIQEGATIKTSDLDVLNDLYLGLGGMIWKNKWDKTKPVSEWYGIKLTDEIYEGERRVEEISLPGQNLVGLLVGGLVVKQIHLEELTYLTKLDLSGNLGLGGELPVDLYKLRFLTELNLSNCSFSNASGTNHNIPEEWGGSDTQNIPYFSNLEVLKLYGNTLSGEVPAAIYGHGNWSKWKANENILPQRSGQLTIP